MSYSLKNRSANTAFASLNENLQKVQQQLYNTITEDQTSIHIIGAPRSGTTLLSQLLLSYTQVGYINNLIAAFWNAPLYGIHLSKKLLPKPYISSFTSEFGATNTIEEPHEFSYFWKKHLDYPDFLQRSYDPYHTIDWSTLKNILYQMTFAYQKPILYKSFQFGFHAKAAVQQMPKTIFFHIKRDVFQNAYSILKLREKRHKDISIWASIKPHQYSLLKNENPYRQVVGQVMFLNHEYKKQLDGIPEKNKHVISYSDLCASPEKVLSQLVDVISHHYKIGSSTDDMLPISENRVAIPLEILSHFENAKKWLLTKYPELQYD